MFATQKSGNKTRSGDGLVSRLEQRSQMGKDQVSRWVSILCLHAVPDFDKVKKVRSLSNIYIHLDLPHQRSIGSHRSWYSWSVLHFQTWYYIPPRLPTWSPTPVCEWYVSPGMFLALSRACGSNYGAFYTSGIFICHFRTNFCIELYAFMIWFEDRTLEFCIYVFSCMLNAFLKLYLCYNAF